MRFKLIVLVCLATLGLTLSAFTEDEKTTSWEKIFEFDLDSLAKWEVDGLGYIYVSQEGNMKKYYPTGELWFEQGMKSLGACSDIVSLNPMKFLHFSQEQQTVCYFDNTLSFTNECLDLSDYEIENASLISASSQPEKLWVLDDIDYRLVLLSLDGLNQGQEIKNIKAILDIESITQIIEEGSKLYLLDPLEGVFVFDRFGSFIEKIEAKGVSSISADENSLFLLQENTLILRMMKSGAEAKIDLPVDGIQQIKYSGKHFYFSTKNKLFEFDLQISK